MLGGKNLTGKRPLRKAWKHLIWKNMVKVSVEALSGGFQIRKKEDLTEIFREVDI